MRRAIKDSVQFDGVREDKARESALVTLRRKKIGFILQE